MLGISNIKSLHNNIDIEDDNDNLDAQFHQDSYLTNQIES